jgi:ABC-2 type transport system permease protein
MRISRRRVGAITRKELREYQHNGTIILAMAILPLAFMIEPLVQVFTLPSTASSGLRDEHALLYMLAVPVLVPAALASYAVVGERLQATLEPMLASPIRREELLLGKAVAAFAPSVVVAYLMFGVYAGIVELFAHPGVATALIRWPDLLAQLVFTPLLASWSIWVGIAISARTRDPRTAQQLAMLASLPAIVITSLTAFNVVPATLRIALVFGIALVVLSRLGWRFSSAIFDRERLITSTD